MSRSSPRVHRDKVTPDLSVAAALARIVLRARHEPAGYLLHPALREGLTRPSLAQRSATARPPKWSAKASACWAALNRTEMTIVLSPVFLFWQENEEGSKWCSSNHVRIASICPERLLGCRQIISMARIILPPQPL